MSYVDGYVIPLPEKNLEAYKAMAENAGKVWMEHGALAYYECIGDDLEEGHANGSFPTAVDMMLGETVVFAYIVFESRAHRDEVNAKVMQDERIMGDGKEMPFDMKRMIYGGFKAIVEYNK